MQLASRRIYTGRVVRLDIDTVQFPDGSTGELELIRHPGAAAVVPCASDPRGEDPILLLDRKSTRLNSSHGYISYAVFCLKKKTINSKTHARRADRARIPLVG